ncbi:NB-ARC domain-containing protein [Aerosakkonema funiforme]|uniref:NB-ARC domain-containing protein n=1 Tax=Aerosakkonema funiforme TaxID=1246630 RepID=UPI0035B6AF5B
MTITEILQFVDRLVFAETDQHLSDIQKNIIQGLLKGQSYKKIADDYGYDEGYIGDISRKLYKILSKQLGEGINKSNFSWTIERLANKAKSNSLQQVLSIINNSHINLCSNNPQGSSKNTEQNLSTTSYHDLTLAPKITHFYDRTLELQILSHWLTAQNPRLVSVLGLSGIGKTTLVKQFVDLNLSQFDVIIWKSIKLSPSLDTIITDIFTLINSEPIQTDNKLTQLFNLLRQQKCLIVIDDVQELFTCGQLAGNYKTEYKDYKTFFTMMTEIEHQSSLILIGQEQCQEMLCLDEQLYPVKCLDLQGLDNTDILKNWGLKDEQSWLALLNLYEGNPVYLKDIVSTIKSIFGGKVSDFLREDTLLLTEEMKFRLGELFDRLSPIEQQIVLELSKYDRQVSREDLREALALSSTDFINGLQSLQKRYLVKSIEGEKILFYLSPVFREYVRSYCQK